MSSQAQHMFEQQAANRHDDVADSHATDHADTLHIHSVTGMDIALRIAGLGGRCFAFLIDFHLRIILALGWVAVMYGLMIVLKKFFGINPLDFGGQFGFYFYMAMALPPALIFLLYHLVLEVFMRGVTPGKRMAGIRIVSKEGITPSQGALVMRNIFRLVDSLPGLYLLGLTTALFTKQHLRIGDIAAGTVLVYAPEKSTQDLDISLPDNGLSASDNDILHDLLERWNQLERAQRIGLAATLLENLGQAVPAYSKSNRQTDKTLHAALTTLQAGATTTTLKS